MRFLVGRTDAIGDVMVSLPLAERILSREPAAEIHWLVQPATAPLLQGHPWISGVHERGPDEALLPMIQRLEPEAVLNLFHRDPAVILAAREAGVPIRVARPRGLAQALAATHRLWGGRKGTRRHEAQNVLDFLKPFGWDGGVPVPPEIFLSEGERALGAADLAGLPRPRLGVVLRGSGAGAFPSEAWWKRALETIMQAGWNPVILAPKEASGLPPGDLRRLLARIAACEAVISPSTGPAHLAAALGVPLLCLMGRRPHHSPDRWQPLGRRVQVIQYPGPEDDLGTGLDRVDPASLVPHLERLR